MKQPNKYLDPAGKPLKAIFLLGTLKNSPEFSHTETLAELVIDDLSAYNVESEIVRLIDFHIKAGVESNMGEGDEWPGILERIIAADIIIFASPIWWGNLSSLNQRVIERLDALNDEQLETGKSRLTNKVGGMVITGDEDGAQHLIGSMGNFMIWNGMTLPPACSVSFLGRYKEKTKAELMKRFREHKATALMSQTAARNLVFFARLLKENNIPEDEKGAS